ncbi:MAG: adenylosuccinate synthase [Bacteroidales bacterium]|jgi:adenylosuccinate synthase|nr:adenylosuccinate synthase [Bacteroidales bacterium]
MKLDVLLGLQWGDEGKGKAVDFLTPQYDVIARFQGGPNAGHSLEFNGMKHVLHTIPSGIFHPEKINIIGNGVVIDPVVFRKEIEALQARGVDLKNLYISRKAHLILPTHRLLDAASEASKGISKIGSTLKGIGPTYMDKTGRNGLRVGDIFTSDFEAHYRQLRDKHLNMLKQYDYPAEYEQEEKTWFEAIGVLKTFTVLDSEYAINKYLTENKSILAEGAQGTMLDIDFGSYPFVTSSNTVCAGTCTGLGVAPSHIGKVYGIVKAYCTRVGSGPFPTELLDATGEELRKKGNEYGSTTGRPRRCGWLDLPALKYSIMINGVTSLIMTKADVLSGFDTIKACTRYKVDGRVTDRVPFDVNAKVEPVYTEMKGWSNDITGTSSFDSLPAELKEYVAFIEKETGVPFQIISVSPDREKTIIK